MDELVVEGGTTEGLQWRLEWETPVRDLPSLSSAAAATRGSLLLRIRGSECWSGNEPGKGFLWTWIELLEFLGDAWPNLILEDGLPLGLRPNEPLAILAEARARWTELPDGVRERQAATVESFRHAHDLSRGLQGAFLAPLWVVREGNSCWLLATERRIYRPIDEVLDALGSLGDALEAKLFSLSDDRARAAVRVWRQRHKVDDPAWRQIATTLSDDKLRTIERGRPPSAVWELDSPHVQTNELLAAARMSSTLDARVIARIVQRVKSAQKVASPVLDRMSEQAESALRPHLDASAFVQGYRLAEWLREQPSIQSATGRVDPAGLLAGWGVRVQQVDFDATEIDAVGCWGPMHGPTIFLNLQGRRNVHDRGQRATLAHELCHLLVDRRSALPLAEVLGGQAPPDAEARANAFAAELLMPRQEAGKVMASGSDDPRRAINVLSRRYGVSTELAAWHARNSDVQLPRSVHEFLRRHVSDPWRY